jgi:FkbM family methyltransferase
LTNVVSGVTAEDIVASIEMILGRTPDQGLIDYHLTLGFRDQFELGRYMLSTDEFARRYASGAATSAEPLGFWEARAHGAALRRQQLKAFGPNARAVLATTPVGTFAVDPEDGFVANSLLHSGVYSTEEVDFALSLLQPFSRVLIVGTHIGTLAIPLARACAKLVALEANPHTFELLQANVLLNNSNNIELYNVAAGEEDGRTIKFVLNRDNSGGSKIMPKIGFESDGGYAYDNPEIIELKTARVDTILPRENFDLIIMDIEGSEVFALRGMPEILRTCGAIAVEFRPHSLIEVAGVDLDAFLDVLAPHYDWLYIPGEHPISKAGFSTRLRQAFDAGTCYDAIYFFKDLPARLR